MINLKYLMIFDKCSAFKGAKNFHHTYFEAMKSV